MAQKGKKHQILNLAADIVHKTRFCSEHNVLKTALSAEKHVFKVFKKVLTYFAWTNKWEYWMQKKEGKTQLVKVINVPCVWVHTLAVKLSFIAINYSIMAEVLQLWLRVCFLINLAFTGTYN